jgi:hypothetical protein
MDLTRSVDFLLDNAGPVIQYRLRKEILANLTKAEEENLLEQVYQTQYFRLLQTYIKPNGYIGSGMHSWDHWRGQTLHETPLQDGETAARLLSYYAVPKTHPAVANFVAAMRDDQTLAGEFSYNLPETARYRDRFLGMNSGFCLTLLLCAMQAMLGYGDDPEIESARGISLEAFKRMLQIHSLSDITKIRAAQGKYHYPYLDEDTYCPSVYHLAVLAYSKAWRSPENIRMMADALNHRNAILPEKGDVQVKIHGRYYAVGLLFRKIQPFRPEVASFILHRRLLTEMAMLGVGERVGVIRESSASVKEAIDADGILRMRFRSSQDKHAFIKGTAYPTAYADVRLETDKKRKYALECDLTFWAVQFLHLVNEGSVSG